MFWQVFKSKFLYIIYPEYKNFFIITLVIQGSLIILCGGITAVGETGDTLFMIVL